MKIRIRQSFIMDVPDSTTSESLAKLADDFVGPFSKTTYIDKQSIRVHVGHASEAPGTLGEFRGLTDTLADDVEMAIATDTEVNRICPVANQPWVEEFPDKVVRLCVAPDTHDSRFDDMDWEG